MSNSTYTLRRIILNDTDIMKNMEELIKNGRIIKDNKYEPYWKYMNDMGYVIEEYNELDHHYICIFLTWNHIPYLQKLFHLCKINARYQYARYYDIWHFLYKSELPYFSSQYSISLSGLQRKNFKSRNHIRGAMKYSVLFTSFFYFVSPL